MTEPVLSVYYKQHGSDNIDVDKWSCSICTYLNDAKDDTCIVCAVGTRSVALVNKLFNNSAAKPEPVSDPEPGNEVLIYICVM